MYRIDKCSMIDGDVPHPVIWIMGNRALLCRWFNYSNSTAHRELMKSIGKTSLQKNDSQSIDLFEVAGCMLRLVMWPTDLLWELVDEVIETHFNQVRHKLMSVQSRESHHHHHVNSHYPTQLMSLHFRCGDYFSK